MRTRFFLTLLAALTLTACGGGGGGGTTTTSVGMGESNSAGSGTPSTTLPSTDPYAKYQGTWLESCNSNGYNGIPAWSTKYSVSFSGKTLVTIREYYDQPNCQGEQYARIVDDPIPFTLSDHTTYGDTLKFTVQQGHDSQGSGPAIKRLKPGEGNNHSSGDVWEVKLPSGAGMTTAVQEPITKIYISTTTFGSDFKSFISKGRTEMPDEPAGSGDFTERLTKME